MSFNDIVQLIQKSELSAHEAKELEKLIEALNDDDRKFVSDLFEENPQWIMRFYDNLKLKQDAFEKRDTAQLSQILESEKKLLDS